MLTKRFVPLILLIVCILPIRVLPQKADAGFVIGGSFVSDSTVVFAVPCLAPPCPTSPTFLNNVKADDHVIFEGALALQLLNARLASLHLELPIAGIPSQTLHLSTSPATVFDHMSTTFVTPGFRVKLIPGAPIAPFGSLGGGWAHYSLAHGSNSKGAIQYGGGLDLRTGIPHLGFRGEVRDFVSGDPNFSLSGVTPGGLTASTTHSGLHRHNILAGGGVVFRF